MIYWMDTLWRDGDGGYHNLTREQSLGPDYYDLNHEEVIKVKTAFKIRRAELYHLIT